MEYDLGSENIIMDNGKIANGKFVIGSGIYSTILFPPGMENIDMPTFILLKKYAEAGGKIIQFSPLQTIDGSRNRLLDEFYGSGYTGITTFDSLNENIIHQLIAAQGCNIMQDKNTHGDLYHYRRKIDDGELIFLSNASMDSDAKGTVITKEKNVLLLDLFTGEMYEYPVKQTPDGAVLQFDIPPAGSRLFFITGKKYTDFKKYVPPDNTGHAIDAVTTVQRSSDNVLTIDFCDVAFDGITLKDKHVFDAADTVFKCYGFKEGNPWNTSVQFKDNTIARDTFSKATGFTATYHFIIKDDINLSGLKAVVESPHLYKVMVNGHEVSPVPGKWWLDKDFKIFEIEKYVHTGQNNLSLTADPMSVYAEIEPVYILGNFNLASAEKGWNIMNPGTIQLGSWKKQGIPMYGQDVVYSKQVTIGKDTNRQYIVQLGEWKGTVATVRVNKQLAGIIAFDPYTCNITPFLKSGQNTVEVCVTGSLKNTLGPHHNHPAPGLVSPWHWRYVKSYPPGSQYDLLDYGLIEDFKILEQNKK